MIVLFNQHITSQELANVVGSTFNHSEDGLKRKNTQPHRVKCNGRYIITESNKTIWPSIGAAKNAIRNHLNISYSLNGWLKQLRVQDAANRDAAVSPYYYNSEELDQIIKYLETNNIIEYVPYTDGE